MVNQLIHQEKKNEHDFVKKKKKEKSRQTPACV